MKPWILATLLIATPCFAVDQKVDPQKQQAERQARFDQAFKTVDSNNDGKISKEEAALKAPPLAANFAAIDTDKDGALSKSEIIDAQQKMNAAIKEANQNFSRRLVEADKDKNGKLSKEEAVALPSFSAHFAEIDSNHDGQLVMKEIMDFLAAQPANAAPSKVTAEPAKAASH